MPKKESAFPSALAALLKSRGIKIPSGLTSAPPEAYAGQSAEVVELLARLQDPELEARAKKIAGFAKRQQERAKAAWDTSPLILELRRRGLGEPPRPDRIIGFAFSVKKPLAQWSDDELMEAAEEWSRLAGSSAKKKSPPSRRAPKRGGKAPTTSKSAAKRPSGKRSAGKK